MAGASHLSVRAHLTVAFLLRLVLIAYGEYQDVVSEVPYTDVDYRVYTDAARHICHLKSPYERHTYRYTPIIALLVLPNVLVHTCFGKILFSIFDLVAGYLIRTIVVFSRAEYHSHQRQLSLLTAEMDTRLVSPARLTHTVITRRKTTSSETSNVKEKPDEQYDRAPDHSMFFWIYNPLTIIISTRGNCDSVAVCLVLTTLYFIEYKRKYFLAGLVHGLAIHVRLYPIVYSLSLFMYLSDLGQYTTGSKRSFGTVKKHLSNQICNTGSQTARRTIFKKEYLRYLVPNYNQLLLISGCVLSLTITISCFYHLYGYTFLYETYIYHFIRTDTRHNFSLFFYLQYLTAGVKNIGLWQKVLTILPQLVLLLVFSIRYGLNKFTIHFSFLTQTIVIVAYNSVLTSQYFIWVLAVLPLTLWQFNLTFKSAIILTVIWFGAQLAWLFPAFLLEFHSQNTFLFIWLQSVSFFCANMAILGRLIKCFMYKDNK